MQSLFATNGLGAMDAVALAWFIGLWIGYARFAAHHPENIVSLLGATNRMRREWMTRVSERENRMMDAAILSNLSTSPSFFASTTIIVIGGLFALLGTTDRAVELVSGLPFARLVSPAMWELKVMLLIAIFVLAFFRFTWALRQFNFVSIMVGSAMPAEAFRTEPQEVREQFVDRAGALVATAAETFNDGLRAYYFGIAASAWFLQPVIFMIATLVVVLILYQREFHSRTLSILSGRK